MYKLDKSVGYIRVGSRKQLNSGDKNLKDNLGIPPNSFEKKLHDLKFARGIRETINYRTLGKSDNLKSFLK